MENIRSFTDVANAPDFIFENRDFDASSGILRLTYRFDSGARFVETITFPNVPKDLSTQRLESLDCAFQTIFYLAGISYYKAYAPKTVRFDRDTPDSATASFLSSVYTEGLGEFYYENNINMQDGVQFPHGGHPVKAGPAGLIARALVPVGGGKDSIVSIEALKAAGKDVTLFALGGPSGAAQPIADTIKESGLPHIYVERVISPEIRKLNESGALNGHVPITAILSAIAVATAILYDFDAVVLSNEHSASTPNLVWHGWDINHQYSKSFAFEQLFAEHVRSHIAADLQYFSLLRPLTEAAIARRFAGLSQYHGIFRSCNTAFKQNVAERGRNWCCNCPKCRFVFLALSNFTDKQHLIDIFGTNMLNDPAQNLGFQQLCGLVDFKPFECVGDISESALMLEKLGYDRVWLSDLVVQKNAQKTENFESDYAALFNLKDGHMVPPDYLEALS